jgi:hypothetical protein
MFRCGRRSGAAAWVDTGVSGVPSNLGRCGERQRKLDGLFRPRVIRSDDLGVQFLCVRRATEMLERHVVEVEGRIAPSRNSPERKYPAAKPCCNEISPVSMFSARQRKYFIISANNHRIN